MPIHGTHDPALVALSYFVAVVASFGALTLAERVHHAHGTARIAWVAGGALTMGLGIWGMHFVGMLAFSLPVPIDYHAGIVAVSIVPAVLASGLALWLVGGTELGPVTYAWGSLAMGAAIVGMHYVGMAAMQVDAAMGYHPVWVGVSVAIAVMASLAALWLAVRLRPEGSLRRQAARLGAAALMGAAIAGMHYTGMAAATFLPVEDLVAISAPVLSLDLLAIVVAVTAFVICGLFLLVLLPDRLDERSGAESEKVNSEQLSEYRSSPSEGASAPATAPRIPVNRNGATRLLAPEEIYAVHADAHYTYVFDGAETHFCNLSISEIEARLDPATFLRVHRSHIVNVAHASALKRVRDQGLLELKSPKRHAVPVSRSRLPKLRAALGI